MPSENRLKKLSKKIKKTLQKQLTKKGGCSIINRLLRNGKRSLTTE